MFTNKLLISIFGILIPLSSVVFGQPSGADCDILVGGRLNDMNCYDCQFIRSEHNVWDYQDPVVHTLPDSIVSGGGAVVYHCTPDTIRDRLVADTTITVSESLNFSESGSGGGRVGLSFVVIAEGSFGLTAGAGVASTVSVSPRLVAEREDVPDCHGVGIESEYTRFYRTGYIREFAMVSYYECDCISDYGITFRDIHVTYKCQPRLVHANSELVRSTAGVWLRAASFNPPRAPSVYSTARCNYCDQGGGGGEDEDDPDPDDGNQDDDGTGGEDDTPYDGDDPNGDDDGDGIPNCEDDTPDGNNGPTHKNFSSPDGNPFKIVIH